MINKKKVAVFFGGRSPEHDVSIFSGLQVLQAIDNNKYESFPVYITTTGQFLVGEALNNLNNYFFDTEIMTSLSVVNLDLSASGRGILHHTKPGLFNKKPPIEFDIALPVFHGSFGENGGFQGLMEFANIAYTGMRAKAAQIFMDKDITKRALKHTNVPMLPHVTVNRPHNGLFIDKEFATNLIADIGFPCCVKPANLGSSIGVGKASNIDELIEILGNIFKIDIKVIIEPFVQNLVEYNIAVRVNACGIIETSAIERPKSAGELLDFKAKYMSSGGSKKIGGVKNVAPSAGMLSMTRDINPDLGVDAINNICTWAKTVYTAFGAGGAPRIDFISNSKTGEIWFNELNPIPGSYAYFLWEPSENNVLFTEMLNDLLVEAEKFHENSQLDADPVPIDARLFKRKK